LTAAFQQAPPKENFDAKDFVTLTADAVVSGQGGRLGKLSTSRQTGVDYC
jgi:hypothetical protein